MNYSNVDQESLNRLRVQETHILITRVFAWMSLAVMISGIIAYMVSGVAYMRSMPAVIGCLCAQLALVFIFAGAVERLSTTAARILFILYSALSGCTLSVIFLQYEIYSIAQIFFASAGMFALSALYGAYTKRSLASWRGTLFMVLFGLICAMLINLFLQNSTFDLLISIIGVLLFSLLTAYDLQMIQQIASQLKEHDASFDKIALICALELYLDFINLFLSMLQLFGRRK